MILPGLPDTGPWRFGHRATHIIQSWTFKLQQSILGWGHMGYMSQTGPVRPNSSPWNWRGSIFALEGWTWKEVTWNCQWLVFSVDGEYLCAREKKENDIQRKAEAWAWALVPAPPHPPHSCSLVVWAHEMSFLLCLVWVRFLSLTEEAKILHYIHKHKKSGGDMRGLSFQVLAYYTRKLKANCDLTYT